jgi:5-methylcytosine-specific restriction endonuclease McrA
MGHFNRIIGIDFEEPRSSGYRNMLAQLARSVVLVFLASLFLAFSAQDANATIHASTQKSRHKPAATHYTRHYSPSRKAVGITRDNHGKIKRSQAEKKKFLKGLGYERVPSGYEVDHIVPLSKGGADKSYNMQLIPRSVHKRKTAAERRHK